jgi:hypothetical protein
MNYKTLKAINLMFTNFVLRNIYKVIYKHSHSKNYKHNRRYWPYYSVKRNAFGGIDKVYFRKKLIADNTLILKSDCKKSMLVATGPSIQKCPTDIFKRQDFDYIGVNGSISLDFVNFKYYVIIDHNFTKNRFDLVLKVIQSQIIFFTTHRCLDIILRKINPEQIKCQIKIVETITKGMVERFLGPRITINPHQDYFYLEGEKGFSNHIHDSVFDYFTVSYVALQIVYSLSYEEIYLAGLDMNNFNQPRFYEKSTNKQPTMLDQYLTEIFPAFEVASHYLNKQNIKVYNLSLKSAIESFDKLDPKLL